MRLFINSLTENLLDFLFPKYCLGCGRAGLYVCRSCAETLKAPKQICIVCQKFASNGLTHAPCLAKNPLAPAQLFCAAPFNSSLARSILHSLKYEFVRELALPCAELIAKRLRERKIYPSLEWSITFVPMHKRRQSLRGFNQAELIAKWLGEILNLEVVGTLEKRMHTKSQATLNRKEREVNLVDTYRAGNGIKGRRLILLDDVCTTGSTLKECSKTLLRAGAAEVRCITFAREI